MDIYKSGLRPLLFSGLKTDPEKLHRQTFRWLNALEDRPWTHPVLSTLYRFSHPALTQSLWNLSFANPLGLAAGFDKDGEAARLWSAFGFGFAELGTVTLHAQPGNPPPRLFRLPNDQAVLNRMGFNNQGAAALAARLQTRQAGSVDGVHLGINLGKSKITALDQAAADYLESFKLLKQLGDYFVVNVSSPNTVGLRSLQAADQLEPILAALQDENREQKPLLIKIAPDLDWDEIQAVVDLARAYQLAGIIATNTTIRRDLKTQVVGGISVQEQAGGISGLPLQQRATDVIRFIYQQTAGELPIIGVGGIFTADDAWDKLTAGASLLQVYTGWIYEGPWMVKRILQGLVQRLEVAGLRHISEAVGLNAGREGSHNLAQSVAQIAQSDSSDTESRL